MISKSGIKSRRSSRAGFSLAEFAIVLGIMGLVIASLWGVVSIVREAVKRNQMSDQMILMVNGIREFYGSRIKVANELGATDFVSVTHHLLSRNVLPSELIRDRSAATLVADHPWGATGASNALLANGGIVVDGATNPSRFIRIQLRGLKYSSCVALADKLTGADMPLGLLSVQINANAALTTLPVSPDIATTQCIKRPAGNGNIMGFIYRLRHQFTQ